MSKERLRKAKKILNHIKGYDIYDGGDDIEVFEWLIEQSERVQELEDRHYRQELIDEHIERLEKQNQRYRESIEFAKLKIKDFETDVKMVWKMAEDKIIKRDARQILDDIADTLEALEGEE